MGEPGSTPGTPRGRRWQPTTCPPWTRPTTSAPGTPRVRRWQPGPDAAPGPARHRRSQVAAGPREAGRRRGTPPLSPGVTRARALRTGARDEDTTFVHLMHLIDTEPMYPARRPGARYPSRCGWRQRRGGRASPGCSVSFRLPPPGPGSTRALPPPRLSPPPRGGQRARAPRPRLAAPGRTRARPVTRSQAGRTGARDRPVRPRGPPARPRAPAGPHPGPLALSSSSQVV